MGPQAKFCLSQVVKNFVKVSKTFVSISGKKSLTKNDAISFLNLGVIYCPKKMWRIEKMIIDGLYYNFIERNLTVSQLTRSSFEAYLRESELMASLGLQSSSYTP